MIARREEIFAEVDHRLGAIEGLGEYERMPSGDPVSFPALHTYDRGQEQDEPDTQSSRYALGIIVEGYVEGASGAAAHASLNGLYAAVVAALITEPPLSGLAETIEEGGMRIDVAELSSERRLGFALEFSITFPTARGRPDEPA